MGECYECKKDLKNKNCCVIQDTKIAFCWDCANEKIKVWKVSIEGLNYCVERDIEYIKELLESLEEGSSYIIEAVTMTRAKYHSLPEFTGF